MIPGKTYRPEDLLEMAWRRKWVMIIPFVTISLGTAVIAHRLPNRYQSETLIQIVPQRVPESYVRSTITSRLEDRLQSLRQQILNRTRLERIIEEFKLYGEERQTMVMEDIVEKMRGDITIQIVKGDAFKVTYASAEPRTAMRVAERLASMIIEENLRDREALTEGASQFFETQLEDSRRRLVEHEKKLEAYRQRYSGELPSQLQSNLQIIQNAQMQLQTVAESIGRDRDRRLVLERMIADVAESAAATAPSPSGSDPEAMANAPAVVRLEAAREQLRLLELRLKPEHPDISTARRLIGELEKKAQAEADAGGREAAGAPLTAAQLARRNRIRQTEAEIANLDLEIARKQQEEERLRRAIVVYQARVDAAPARESDLVALMRDYDTLQKIYATLLTKKEDSQIAANLERRQIGEQFKMLDPARLPEKPFSPNRTRINLFGALVGLLLGVGLAALLEYKDTALRTDEDVMAALALPVLAVIPFVPSVVELRKAKRRRRLVTAACLGLLAISAVVSWKLALIPVDMSWIGNHGWR